MSCDVSPSVLNVCVEAVYITSPLASIRALESTVDMPKSRTEKKFIGARMLYFSLIGYLSIWFASVYFCYKSHRELSYGFASQIRVPSNHPLFFIPQKVHSRISIVMGHIGNASGECLYTYASTHTRKDHSPAFNKSLVQL